MRSLFLLLALTSATTAHALTFATIDTPTTNHTSELPAVAMYQSQANVFVADRDLATNLTRLKWCRPTFLATCVWTVIDGAANDLEIPTGGTISPVVWSGDGRLHVFYTNRISGSGVLRHAVLTTSGWFFENLDGLGGAAGRITANIGGWVSAIDFAPPSPETSKLYISYLDATNGDLRIARSAPKVGWSFSTIDGDGAFGHINSHVGAYNTLVVHNNIVNALYADSGNGDLRHARLLPTGWTNQRLDGNGEFTTDYVVSPIAAVVSGPWLHIMYNHVNVGGITHAWTAGGGAWGYAHHDGDANTLAITHGGGCSDGTLMYFPYSTGPIADPDLKVTTSWSSSPWGFGVWDGHINDGMRIAGPVGANSACAGAGYRAYFVYTHDLGSGRTAIRYAFSDPPA